jgi:hypothetical protein
MGGAWRGLQLASSQLELHHHTLSGTSLPGITTAVGGTVYDIFASDWFYIGLTIVIFAALWLLVKGVERFER